MNKKVVIIGAGGHAKVISEIVELNNDICLGFLDDNKTGENIIGTISDIEKIHNEDNSIEFIIAIGNNELRNKIYKTNSVKYYTAIHPSCIISPSAIIGVGSAIMAGVIINSNSTIGENCIINTASIIEHGCKIEDGAHLSYRVTVGSESKVGKEAYIEAGATIDRNVQINDYERVEIGKIVKGEV